MQAWCWQPGQTAIQKQAEKERKKRKQVRGVLKTTGLWSALWPFITKNPLVCFLLIPAAISHVTCDIPWQILFFPPSAQFALVRDFQEMSIKVLCIEFSFDVTIRDTQQITTGILSYKTIGLRFLLPLSLSQTDTIWFVTRHFVPPLTESIFSFVGLSFGDGKKRKFSSH